MISCQRRRTKNRDRDDYSGDMIYKRSFHDTELDIIMNYIHVYSTYAFCIYGQSYIKSMLFIVEIDTFYH